MAKVVNTTIYCDRCGKETTSNGPYQFVLELDQGEQSHRYWAMINLYYHERRNGGKDIDNGDLCKECAIEIFQKMIDQLKGE